MRDVAQSELIKGSGRDPELRAWISKRALLIPMGGAIVLNDFSSATYTKGGEGEDDRKFPVITIDRSFCPRLVCTLCFDICHTCRLAVIEPGTPNHLPNHLRNSRKWHCALPS